MKIFEVGEPIPLSLLHMEFTHEDTVRYGEGEVIPHEEELNRLVEAYLDGVNEE